MRALCRAALAALIGASLLAGGPARAVDLDALWDYDDPAASEQRFRDALAQAASDDERLELLTQVARTHSLRGDFAAAHRVLDEIEPRLDKAGPAPRVRAGLERGRTFNSAGEPQRARPLFEAAFETARAAHLDALAVDAAHMVAITHGGTPAAVEWNRRGLELARGSRDRAAQALVPALLNNLAWDLHDMGRPSEALPVFEEALAEWRVRRVPPRVQVARWSVARCLRTLGRYEEALAIQRALAADHERVGTADGYVFEELGEDLAALGRADEARPWFARAAEVLGQDPQFAKNEAKRLASLRERGR